MAWNKKAFTSGSSWTAPAGVTQILAFGYGGGGGGGGGSKPNNDASKRPVGGSGGGGATPAWSKITVTPGTTYNIQIGAAGTGGPGCVAALGGAGTIGNDGTDTIFDTGSNLHHFFGGSGGSGGQWSAATPDTEDHWMGYGPSNPNEQTPRMESWPIHFGDGGSGRNNFSASSVASYGMPCNGGYNIGASPGAIGADAYAPYHGGGPGGGGGGGYTFRGATGGAGGASVNGTGAVGSPGSNAATPNSGAGGGGGGAGGDGPAGGGNGGDGGDGITGYLVIYWWT